MCMCLYAYACVRFNIWSIRVAIYDIFFFLAVMWKCISWNIFSPVSSCLSLLRSTSFFQLVIAINGNHDANTGLHVIDGDGGSTNYRTLAVSGNLQLKKGQYASVFVFSSFDDTYTVHSETGTTHMPCALLHAFTCACSTINLYYLSFVSCPT